MGRFIDQKLAKKWLWLAFRGIIMSMETTLPYRQAAKDIAMGSHPALTNAQTGDIQKEGIVVAIPCYNEEVAIGSMVLRSLKYAEKVVVIDDGSTDKTAEVARMAGAEVLAHGSNLGKGVSIRDAFEYIKRTKANAIVLIDGDGQHNPDEIPVLLKPILLKEADIVNGSRFIANNGNSVPLYRRFGQSVLTTMTNIGTRQRLSDSQNGFRAFSRNSFDYFTLNQKGMAIESEMLIDAACANLKIVEVPIGVRYDVDGSTHNPIKHGFSVFNSVIILISQRRPMLFFALPGFILLLSGTTILFLMLGIFNQTRYIDANYAIIGMLCIILGTIGITTSLMLTSIQNFKTKPSQF
jgi:glycosyltransferase involved in cell wall biosynthesis